MRITAVHDFRCPTRYINGLPPALPGTQLRRINRTKTRSANARYRVGIYICSNVLPSRLRKWGFCGCADVAACGFALVGQRRPARRRDRMNRLVGCRDGVGATPGCCTAQEPTPPRGAVNRFRGWRTVSVYSNSVSGDRIGGPPRRRRGRVRLRARRRIRRRAGPNSHAAQSCSNSSSTDILQRMY